jgi:hypothetical protein
MQRRRRRRRRKRKKRWQQWTAGRTRPRRQPPVPPHGTTAWCRAAVGRALKQGYGRCCCTEAGKSPHRWHGHGSGAAAAAAAAARGEVKR